MPNLREETFLLIPLRSWCYLFLLSQAGVWGLGTFIASHGSFEAAATAIAGPEFQAATVRALHVVVFPVVVVAGFSGIAMMVIIWEIILEKVR